jgi:hypothetical protein
VIAIELRKIDLILAKENLKMPKQAETGRSVHLHAGDTFEWTNHGETDCVVTQCDPPLERGSYPVPAGRSVQAKVRDGVAKKKYEYKCSCNDLDTNPHIIID